MSPPQSGRCPCRGILERHVRIVAVQFVHVLVALVILAPEVRDVLRDVVRGGVHLPLRVEFQVLAPDDPVGILEGLYDVVVEQIVTAPLAVVQLACE